MADTLQLIKTVVADGSSATMDTGTLTGDLDVLRVVVEIEGGGSGGCRMRFNSDTGSNYRRLFSENGGSKDGHSDGASNAISNMVGRTGRRSYSINTIYNISGKETSGYGHCITDGGNTGSANAPTRMEYAFKWANTAQITSIQIISDSTSWTSGSTLNVYAYSRADEEISDEKTTLADATSDTTQVAGTSDITDLTWTQTVGSSTSDTFYVLKDTSNDLMDIKAAGNCGTDGSPSIAYATLSEALGTTYWRMRFKLVFNTVTAESTGGKSFFTNFFIVDNGTGSSGTGSENGFGFKFIADAGSTQTQFYSTTSGTDSGTTMSWTPSSSSTIYAEISWEGGTATANFYSDSGYSNRVSSTTANATRSGTFSGLKFPQIALRQDNGGDGVMEIDMSNLEIINRVLTAPNANTRYEEIDTRKIYRWKAESSVDATYTEDMSDTTDWSFADTGAVNVTSGSLSYSLNRNGSNDCATYDFGSTISDTKFLLRFSHTPTAQSHSSGSNCIGFFGLSDNTSGQGTSQDFIGFNFASNDNDGSTTKNNTTLVANSVTGQASNSHTSGTKYYEIKRNSATEVVFTVYNNSDFTGVYRTQTESSLSSSITSLRYFKFANWHSSGSGSCSVTGTMDDLQLWDGVNSTTSSAEWVERGSA